MDKPDKTSISGALAAATCSLLGTAPPEPVQAQEEAGWDFNTSLLYYGEDEDRVQDLSFATLATRTLVDERILSLGLTVDALTGASPNGALPQPYAQTFTQPSGKRTFTTLASDLPTDDTFRDTRVALSADWQQTLGRLYQFNVGATASNEYDYTHLGVNTRIARDFNQRNTTLSAGLAFASDDISPVGGTPDPLTSMRLADRGSDGDEGGSGKGSESKEVLDVVFGVTQVISRDLLVQLNYSYSTATGYLNDPYKVLSVIDEATGLGIPVAPTPGIDGPSHLYLYENRPDERTKHSLYGQAKYYMGGKVLDASYRFMTDDWEIDSHTLDVRYRWPLGERSYLEPHFRYYSQSAAEFYTLALPDGETLPEYASADYRLGDFNAITAGLKYGWTTRGGNDFSVRLELYRQTSDIARSDLVGSQLEQDNVPDLNAVIFQVGYRFGL